MCNLKVCENFVKKLRLNNMPDGISRLNDMGKLMKLEQNCKRHAKDNVIRSRHCGLANSGFRVCTVISAYFVWLKYVSALNFNILTWHIDIYAQLVPIIYIV